MTFQVVEGILLTSLGNIFTGTSQVLQKQALTVLSKKPLAKRYQSKRWLLGISLSYAGDILNFIAYSKCNPALLSPLGIISIFTVCRLSLDSSYLFRYVYDMFISL